MTDLQAEELAEFLFIAVMERLFFRPLGIMDAPHVRDQVIPKLVDKLNKQFNRIDK